tara:strand:+ start:1234 stop:1662 length:429 start_codon:yes stop_codon:yes gene_type:complete
MEKERDQPHITIQSQHRRIEKLELNQQENKIKYDNCCDELKQLNNHVRVNMNIINSLRATDEEHWGKIDKLQKKWNRQFQSATKFATSLRIEQLKGDRKLEAEIKKIREAMNGGGKTKKRRKRRKKRRTRKPKKKRRKTKRR